MNLYFQIIIYICYEQSKSLIPSKTYNEFIQSRLYLLQTILITIKISKIKGKSIKLSKRSQQNFEPKEHIINLICVAQSKTLHKKCNIISNLLGKTYTSH